MLTIIGCIGVGAPLYSLRDRIYSSRVLFRIKLLAEQMAECAAQCATVTCAAETRGGHTHFGPVPGLQKYYIITVHIEYIDLHSLQHGQLINTFTVPNVS